MDERLIFQNALRDSLGKNDNTSTHEESESADHTEPATAITISENSGNTINIGKLELSVVLSKQKKNVTYRTIVLALRELLLSSDNLSKKSTSYPPVDGCEARQASKKNAEMFTFMEVNTALKKTSITSDNLSYRTLSWWPGRPLPGSQKAMLLLSALSDGAYKKTLAVAFSATLPGFRISH